MGGKFAPPEAFHKILPRSTIASVIDGASLGEAVCLVAPYGCGKTMAVLSWLKGHGLDAAWLTLDDSDDSEDALLTSLTSAILRFSGRDTDDLTDDPNFCRDPGAFLRDAVMAAETMYNDRVLIIDNLRFLRDPRALSLLKGFIAGLLGRWRIILISRNELSSTFNDMLLKRQICLISHTELNFSAEEIEKFFNMNDCSATEQSIEQIRDETEGWPAALNVILILSRGGEADYGEAARGYLRDFFETEIWDGLSDDKRDFLIKTAVLDRLTPASCNAVTDLGATRPTLRWLFVNGMFVSMLPERDAFRYHRVFRVFLLEKLAVSGINVVKLYDKVAWWLFEKERYEESFSYFFKAKDYYGLSRVFRILNPTFLGMDRYIELVRQVAEWDVYDLRDYPLIAARVAMIHFLTGDLDEMDRVYRLMLSWEPPGELRVSPEEYAEYMWELGWIGYLNPAEPIEKNDRHSEWIQYAEREPALQMQQNLRGAYIRNHSVLSGHRDYCPALRSIEEFVRENDGDINGSSALMQIDIVRAEYAYELEDYAKAERLIRAVLTQAEKQELTDLCFICVAVLTKITRATRKTNGITAMTAHIKKMIERSGYEFMWPRFHAFELRNMLADGFKGQTEVFAEENKDYMDHPYILHLWNHMTLARALLSTGDIDEAAILLSRLAELCHKYGRIRDGIEVKILQSVAAYKLGYEDTACTRLAEAVEVAREYGFIRVFSDEARDIWTIFEIMGFSSNDTYIKSIIISCKKTLARAGFKLNRRIPKKSGLTKTELKVLLALATDMSYEEIALDHNVKLSTVKSQVHSIYSKLNTNSRTAAVVAARKSGFIP